MPSMDYGYIISSTYTLFVCYILVYLQVHSGQMQIFFSIFIFIIYAIFVLVQGAYTTKNYHQSGYSDYILSFLYVNLIFYLSVR